MRVLKPSKRARHNADVRRVHGLALGGGGGGGRLLNSSSSFLSGEGGGEGRLLGEGGGGGGGGFSLPLERAAAAEAHPPGRCLGRKVEEREGVATAAAAAAGNRSSDRDCSSGVVVKEG